MGCETSADCDPTPYLRVRKQRKFMGPQDALAVVAAGRALESAGIAGEALGEGAGIFLAVGAIPFERDDIDRLLDASMEEGRLSMRRFFEKGIYAVHPNLTFRCLSNMPVFHVSTSFDVQGPYFVTYPGLGQWYVALEEACSALREGALEKALLISAAYQRNFLVRHHGGRLDPPVQPGDLRDAGACLLLETEARARRRGALVRGRLVEFGVRYRPHHPLEEYREPAEEYRGCPVPRGDYGPAALSVALARAPAGKIHHSFRARDGTEGSSQWEVL
jgi:3-oxoacyl-(acyl-carrier-protein) synthase